VVPRKKNPIIGNKKTYPNGNALVICPRGKFDNKLGSGPLLGIVERAEPADDPDAVLAGRCLLLLGHGGGDVGGGGSTDVSKRGQRGRQAAETVSNGSLTTDHQLVLFIPPGIMIENYGAMHETDTGNWLSVRTSVFPLLALTCSNIIPKSSKTS
jgi:hypothetical protein